MNKNNDDDYHEYDKFPVPGIGEDGTPGYRGPRTRRTHGSHHRHFCSRDWPQLECKIPLGVVSFAIVISLFYIAILVTNLNHFM